MLERAAQKLRLDQLVIQQGRQQQSKGMSRLSIVDNPHSSRILAANKDELLEMITAGAEKIINTNDEYVFSSLVSFVFANFSAV